MTASSSSNEMNRRQFIVSASALTALVMAGPDIARPGQAAHALTEPAAFPPDEREFRGGLAVWIGSEEPAPQWAQRLFELHDRHGVLVMGLHPSAEAVAEAREHLKQRGVYGEVSVDHLNEASSAGIPLIDESVNLLVVEEGSPFSNEEIERVLTPLGVAAVNNGGAWERIEKPWPEDIGEWTHYLGDDTNNAVARDSRVAPPRHLQWQAGPLWSRHHEHMSSVSATVSARGRLFTILDEGPRESQLLPAAWKLVARDAFNGALLWKRSIDQWQCHLWPLKSGPASLPRRLVAVGDTVYVTLGLEAPVTALDAATGRTLREYEGTAGAEEIVYSNGVLLVLVNRASQIDLDEVDVEEYPPGEDGAVSEGASPDDRVTWAPPMDRRWAAVRSPRWAHSERVIMAFDADSGEELWSKANGVLPLTLAADGERAYHCDSGTRALIAVDLRDGRERWASGPLPVWEGVHGQGLHAWFAPTLLVYDGVVMFAGGENMHLAYRGWGREDQGEDTMRAFDAATGEELWTAGHPYSGYNSPQDLFAARGKVWAGETARGQREGYYAAHNLRTGDMEAQYPPGVDTYWFHQRCYRAKATENYILPSRTGVEFIDMETGEWTIHHWVRGACLYGVMPANGMLYATPHPCACYSEALLKGFIALAPPSASRQAPEIEKGQRLERGPAYEAISEDEQGENAADWPTYRGDAARSGAATSAPSVNQRPAWSVKLGERLTPPIVANGWLFAAEKDRHTIHAMDAASGERRWSFTAGGRIDSPPTYDKGRLFFGSADGYVYCLRARDGALAWRYLAAPADRRMVAHDQVESSWPVHGAVLVQDGVVSLVAGRSMFVDGGLRFLRLDAATGEVLSEKTFDDRDPETGENLQIHVQGLSMAVALPDILSSDGERLYMGSQVMNLVGERLELGPGASGHPHLFAPYGFTEDSWFHRTYWVYADQFRSGVGSFQTGNANPAGRILAHNASKVFGYGRKPGYWRWSSVLENHLFGEPKSNAAVAAIYFDNSPSLNPAHKPLSIAAWVKTSKPDGAILVRGANVYGYALIITGGKPEMLLRMDGTTRAAVSGESIGAEWTHVAGVLDEDGRMTVYVDGRPTGETTDVPLIDGEPSVPMKIGYDDANQLRDEPLTPFEGVLDDVMLFHRALSEEEIAALADPEAALSDEMRKEHALHMTFEDGTFRDASGAGNHGRGPQAAAFEIAAGPNGGDAVRFKQPSSWSQEVPMLVRAMCLAGDVLFIAGPPDLVDEPAAYETFDDPETQAKLAEQERAFRGEAGALFHAVDAETGETLAEYPLDAPPVFDGLITAAGHLFLTTLDGRVLAYGPAEEPG